MSSFWKNRIEKGGLHDLFVHLIPAVLAVALLEIIAIEVYLNASLGEMSVKFFAWKFAQGVGGCFFGYFSDKFCRKKTLIFTQLFGVLLLPWLLWSFFSIAPLFIIGLLFSPSPVARAALIDNFLIESKVKLIGLTYIAQFIPWCFYQKIKHFTSYEVIIAALIALIINTTIVCLFFEDRRDKTSKKEKVVLQNIFPQKKRKIVFHTLCAVLTAQLVFFVSDTFFETLTSHPSLFSALGVGSIIGVVIGIFYRKTPHLSTLTFCFGIGILLSSVPLITNYLFSGLKIYLPYQVMLFSSLGGFYLPFVFDVVLSASSASHRGAICGIIDIVITLASVIGASIVILFRPTEELILLMTSILFFVSTFIQKKGEKHA